MKDQGYSFPSSHVFFNMSLKTSKKIHLQEIYSVILVLSILKLFWITANPNISGHNASLLLPVCLAGGFEESAMPLLSATIRTHSIFCQILCFSIFFFFHELHCIPFYWSLHFLRCSAQNWTIVLIFSWSFMEFWIEVKVYFTYSYLYLLIQHWTFTKYHENTDFCWTFRSPGLFCRNATHSVIFEPEFIHDDDSCPCNFYLSLQNYSLFL